MYMRNCFPHRPHRWCLCFHENEPVLRQQHKQQRQTVVAWGSADESVRLTWWYVGWSVCCCCISGCLSAGDSNVKNVNAASSQDLWAPQQKKSSLLGLTFMWPVYFPQTLLLLSREASCPFWSLLWSMVLSVTKLKINAVWYSNSPIMNSAIPKVTMFSLCWNCMIHLEDCL